VTMMRQVAGDYIARDIACAAPDARIVIIATQVRYSMQQFCYCLHTDIPAKIFCHVLTHRRRHHHHPPLFASSLLLLFNALQGGASATIDFAAICRKRIVVTGSLLRPQTQQQKACQPSSAHFLFLHSTAFNSNQAALCSGLLNNVWPLFESKQLRSKVCARVLDCPPLRCLVPALSRMFHSMTGGQVHSVFPASECVRAHQLMDSGDFTGKIVLSWSEM
jgi:hypothetical protein